MTDENAPVMSFPASDNYADQRNEAASNSCSGATRTARRDKQRIIHQEMAKPGLRGLINAKCVECVYDEFEPGSWREQVYSCTSRECPLYGKRPSPNAASDPKE